MVRAISSYLVHMIVLKAEMWWSFFYLVTLIVCTVSNMQIIHFSPGKKLMIKVYTFLYSSQKYIYTNFSWFWYVYKLKISTRKVQVNQYSYFFFLQGNCDLMLNKIYSRLPWRLNPFLILRDYVEKNPTGYRCCTGVKQ